VARATFETPSSGQARGVAQFVAPHRTRSDARSAECTIEAVRVTRLIHPMRSRATISSATGASLETRIRDCWAESPRAPVVTVFQSFEEKRASRRANSRPRRTESSTSGRNQKSSWCAEACFTDSRTKAGIYRPALKGSRIAVEYQRRDPINRRRAVRDDCGLRRSFAAPGSRRVRMDVARGRYRDCRENRISRTRRPGPEYLSRRLSASEDCVRASAAICAGFRAQVESALFELTQQSIRLSCWRSKKAAPPRFPPTHRIIARITAQ